MYFWKEWIRKRKNQNRQKRKEKFSFLTEEIREMENRLNLLLKDETDSRILPAVDLLSSDLREESSYLLQECRQKNEELAEEIRKGFAFSSEQTENAMNSLNARLTEEIQSTVDKVMKSVKSEMKRNSNKVVLEMEDIKSLLKILAVNHLIDEIHVDR